METDIASQLMRPWRVAFGLDLTLLDRFPVEHFGNL